MKIEIGQQAPDFLMFDTEKSAVRLSALKGENVLLANDLPGFGNTNQRARVVLNYYISYRIAFKTKAKIPLLKKVVGREN